MRRGSILIMLILLALQRGVLAAAAPEPPVVLEADQVDIDERKGISTYTGNVKLTRGALTVLSDRLVVHRAQQELQKVVATGNPVRLHQAADATTKEVRGEGKQLEYAPKSGEIVLQEQAVLHQERDEFSGSLIRYNLNTKTVNASKGQDGDQRVRVVIHPKQDDKTPP